MLFRSDSLDSNGNNYLNWSYTADDVTNKKGTVRINGLVGSSNQKGYMNYLVVVRDEAGNTSSFTYNVSFDNTMTAVSIANSSGTKLGGRLVVVLGSGFSSSANNNIGVSTKIYFNSTPCLGVNILSTGIITCTTPAMASGGMTVVTVQNPDGSSVTISGGYTFTDGGSFPYTGCDAYAAAASTTQFASGNGSLATPFLICNRDQLLLMGNDSYRILGAYFKLGDNLDLSAWGGFSPIGTNAKPFSGVFDGDGHLISSLSYSSGASNPNGVGMFGNVTTLFEFKNTVVMGFNIQSTATSSTGVYVGSILGKTDGETLVKISGVSLFNSIVTVADISDPYYVTDGSGAGGIFGYIGYGNTTTSGSLFSNITISGVTVNAKLGGYLNSLTSDNSHYDGTGLVGGSMLYKSTSTTFESFSNISIDNSVLNCRAGCGGVIGRSFRADFNNINISSLQINTYSVLSIVSNYLGANGVGFVAGKIGSFVRGNNSTGVALAKDINIAGDIKITNAVSGTPAPDADGMIGGVFGLVVPYTNASFQNISTKITVDNVATSGNAAQIAPVSFVGGVVGLSIVYNRTDANGTVDFTNLISSSTNIHCDNNCGGIVGGVLIADETSDKSTYLKTYQFVKNKIDVIFNFSGTTTSVANDSAKGGHGGVIGRFASNTSNANKISIILDKVAARGVFNDIDAYDFAGGAIGVYDVGTGTVNYPSNYETVTISNSFFSVNMQLMASIGANTGGIIGYHVMNYFDFGTWTYGAYSSKIKVSNS